MFFIISVLSNFRAAQAEARAKKAEKLAQEALKKLNELLVMVAQLHLPLEVVGSCIAKEGKIALNRKTEIIPEYIRIS